MSACCGDHKAAPSASVTPITAGTARALAAPEASSKAKGSCCGGDDGHSHGGGGGGGHAHGKPKVKAKEPNAVPDGCDADTVLQLSIGGMDCSSCVELVENALRKTIGNGYAYSSISAMTGQAEVVIDSHQTTPQAVSAVIESVGFKARFLSAAKYAASGAAPAASAGAAHCRILVPVLQFAGPVSVARAASDADADARARTALLRLPGVVDVTFDRRRDGGSSSGTSIGDSASAAVTKLLSQHTPGSSGGVSSLSSGGSSPRAAGGSSSRLGDSAVSVRISYQSAQTGVRRLLRAVQTDPVLAWTNAVLGEGDATAASDSNSAAAAVDAAAASYLQRFKFSLWFTIPIVLIEYLFVPAGWPHGLDDDFANGLSPATLLAWMLSTPVQLVVGWPLYVSAYKALRYARTANMDALVMLSTTVAYVYSALVTLARLGGAEFGGEVFFETSAVLLALVMLGRTMEVTAKGKASRVLTRMLEMQAPTALLLERTDNGDAAGSSDAKGASTTSNGVASDKPAKADSFRAGRGGRSASVGEAAERIWTDCCCRISSHVVCRSGTSGQHEHHMHGKQPVSTQPAHRTGGYQLHVVPMTALGGAMPVKADGCCSPLSANGEPNCPLTLNAVLALAAGHVVPDTASGKTLVPTLENVVMIEGAWTTRELNVELLEVGDLLRVLPGGKIPTDGVLVAGDTTVDESMVTGESRPIRKRVRSRPAAANADGVTVASPSAASLPPATAASLPDNRDDHDGGHAQNHGGGGRGGHAHHSHGGGACGVDDEEDSHGHAHGGDDDGHGHSHGSGDGHGHSHGGDDAHDHDDHSGHGHSHGAGGCSGHHKPAATAVAAPTHNDANAETILYGSSINQSGAITMRVTKLVHDNTLSAIARLVSQAQGAKPEVQRVADRVAAWFVPFIVVSALVAGVVWYSLAVQEKVMLPNGDDHDGGSSFTFALQFAIATLVVSCPCAIGLAVPTAVMSSTGVGAKLGIIFKGGGPVIESCNRVTTIVFDKTGTLTYGKPAVYAAKLLPTPLSKAKAAVKAVGAAAAGAVGAADKEFWHLIGSAESSSEHPIAKGVVEYAKRMLSGRVGANDADYSADESGVRLSTPTDAQAKAGLGVRCVVDGHDVMIGSERFVIDRVNGEDDDGEEQGDSHAKGSDVKFDATKPVAADHPDALRALRAAIDEWSEAACTVVCVRIDGRLRGAIALRDQLRPESRHVVQALRQRLGIDVWLCSGDNKATVSAVARELGLPLDKCMAGVMPSGKADAVAKLQRGEMETDPTPLAGQPPLKRVVAMVGDGVNDSPALAQADVGIAVASGTDIALEAASVVLLKHNLTDVLVTFELSRSTFRLIRVNFLWALLYNLTAIPFATGMFYNADNGTGITLPPSLAGVSELLSSVPVVLFSLLLQRYTPSPALLFRGSVHASDSDLEMTSIAVR